MLGWAFLLLATPGYPAASAAGSGPFVPSGRGPAWWPPVDFTAASGELLPNPGASLLAFQFNGPYYGQNYISLPRSLSAALPRSMTIELWAWIPASATGHDAARKRCVDCFGPEPDAGSPGRAVLPLVSRFNPRMTQGPENLEAYVDFALQVDVATGQLEFFMGGGYAADYGFNIRAPGPVAVDEWVHLAVSVVSSENRNPYFAMLFVDGVQLAAANWLSGAHRNFLTTDVVTIGHYARGAESKYYMEGVLDEVRFWGGARREADLQATLHKLLQGDEQGLVALYRLDDAGAAVQDAGPGAHHGHSLRPLYTLSWAPMLNWTETGVQGFPVDILLTAIDLVPTPPDGFEFTVTCLPDHGAIFLPGQCVEEPCVLDETDLGYKTVSGLIHFVCDADFLGVTSFCYAARRIGESEWSLSATVDVTCVEAPPSGCLGRFDECGVCNGDGTSCTTGGCDGHGGVVDACGVCAGDNSTCMCAVYQTYKLSELDCIMFDHAVNRTIKSLNQAIRSLGAGLAALADYEPSPNDGFSLFPALQTLCSVRQCVAEYDEELDVFTEYVDAFLKTAYLCEVSETAVLEDSDRVLNDHTRPWVRALQSS